MNVITRKLELSGSSRNIGKRLAESGNDGLIDFMKSGEEMSNADMKEIIDLFDKWCPGLNDELQGFADVTGVSLASVSYYAATYLRPSCSQLAISAPKSANGRPILARSYEYHPKFEEFTLVRTSVDGKYSHIGTSVVMFGREEGLNDQGLAVAMSMNSMREIKVRGMMFWAALRSVLENCATVDEAVNFLSEMPIAYNMNMILLDASEMALYETMDGQHAFYRASQEELSLIATNHPLLEPIIKIYPSAAVHSLQRYESIQKFLNENQKIGIDQIKALLLDLYPNGLNCRFYEEYFGTTKSAVIDPIAGTFDLCWGGRAENGWECFNISETLPEQQKEIQLIFENAPSGTYGEKPLNGAFGI